VRLEEGTPFDDNTYQDGIALLTSLVEAEIRRSLAHQAGEAIRDDADPPSDDFVTFRQRQVNPSISAAEQISSYLALRHTGQYGLDIWSTVRPEMVELRTVALKALSVLTTSASAERAFSVAALLCGPYQMAMSAATVSRRLIVQANWPVASRFLPEVLGVGPKGWAAWERRYRAEKGRFVPLPIPELPPPPDIWDRFDIVLDEAVFDSGSSDDESPGDGFPMSQPTEGPGDGAMPRGQLAPWEAGRADRR
jgi:hypothetical protein